MRTHLLALALLAGCASDGEPDSASCMALAGEHTVAAADAIEGLTACGNDADCVLLTPILDCAEGDYYEECPVAVRAGSEAEYETRLRAATAHLCVAMDCLSIPGCPTMTPICRDGSCVTVSSP